MRVCKNCTLNDNISSVTISDDDLCNYCRKYGDKDVYISSEDYENKEKQFIEACNQYKDLPYQVLLAYSGGKDSTYTLYLLREKYNLSVLAVTFDNGFLTEECRKNIHKVTAHLNVDNVTIKPSFSNLAKVFNLAGSNEIFPRKSLERASSICTACIGIVKSTIYKEAILREIPFVSFGWTPGQVNLKASVVKLDYKMLLANQKQIEGPIINNLGEEYKKYFMDEEWLKTRKENIPCLVHPLLFNQYHEDKITDTIRAIGWERPADTDMNSTNCLLNSYANHIHNNLYGYNPYSLEIANLVREGHMNRQEGLNKIAKPGDDSVIDYVRAELERYL